MRRILIRIMLVFALLVVPCAAQSTRDYPEPCNPYIFSGFTSPRVIIPEGANLWMLVRPGSGGVRYDAYSISISKSLASSCVVHYIKVNAPPGGQYKEEAHLTADIPLAAVKGIERLWETILRQTRYQQPKGVGGMIEVMLHGDSCYFGYDYRYFGQVNFLAAGSALLIQKTGYELVKYVQGNPMERSETLKRIENLVNQIEKSSP